MRPVIVRLIVLAWLVVGAVAGAAGEADASQPWPHRDAIQTWRVGSGLPHQRVQAVCQTNDGFLWVGTAQGLARFDGLKFERAPLPDNPSVVRLAAGKGNHLWVGAADGTLWRGDGMRFEKALNGKVPGGFEILVEDRDGRLWITSSYSPKVFLLVNGELRNMTDVWEKAGMGHASQVRVDEKGNPIANGPLIWTVEGETLKLVPGFQSGMIYHAPGRDQSYWVSDGTGVRRLSGGTLSPPVGPANWGGRDIAFGIEDHERNLWVASKGYGILCYGNPEAHRRLDTRDGLCGDFASCLYVDRQGNLWVGSDGGGLSRVTPALFSVAGRNEGLSSDRVTAVAQGPGNSLWIGTHADGLNRFDGRSFSRVAGFSERWGVLSLASKGDELWIGISNGVGSWSNGSLRMLRGWNRADRAAQALFHDRSGRLWVGQRSAGSVICLRDNEPREIRLRPDAQPEFDVRTFAEDDKGRVWIATDGAGLFCHSEGKVQSVGTYRQVTALGVGKNGEMWIAADGGLTRVRDESGSWHIENGWHPGVLHTLSADAGGALWATDDRGVCRLDTSILPCRMTRFGEADGLPGLQGTASGNPQSVRDNVGRLWFATTAGITTVEPSRFSSDDKVPDVILEELRVNGFTRWRSGQKEAPVFQSEDRGFEFRFTAIDLRHPEMLDFATRIDGVDDGWTNLGRTNSIFHATLPAGEHRFRVKVRDRSGKWSETESMAFNVLPPLWQRGWFISVLATLALCIAAGIAWLVARWRMQRQLAVLMVERALEGERARIARDLHDQLGSGLTQIAFLGDALLMDGQDASGEAAEVSTRARELTRTMDETVWALDPVNDTFEGLISYLGHAMPVWLKATGIRCRLEFPDQSLRFGLDTRTRREIYLACKEAVHNAVKHSGTGTITLRIEKTGQTLVITLSDEGCGFDPAAIKSGNGLTNLKSRLSDLGGTTRITSLPGQGTTVCFTLPLPGIA